MTARAQSARKARATYNARNTEEGRALHAAEEAARRERRGLEKQSVEQDRKPATGSQELPVAVERICDRSADWTIRVGDQRCTQPFDDAKCSSVTAPYAVTEVIDATPFDTTTPLERPISQSGGECEGVDWILVVPSVSVRAALRRVGTMARCPFCGQRGRIGRVVSTDQWERWIRRGLEPPG